MYIIIGIVYIMQQCLIMLCFLSVWIVIIIVKKMMMRFIYMYIYNYYYVYNYRNCI